MAVPRPILLALLATLLLAVTFMATRSSKVVSENVANPAVPAKPQASAPAEPGTPNALDAKDAVRAIVSPGKPVNSARFRLRISAKELGGKHKSQSAVYTGSFAPGASGGLTGFDVKGRDAKTAVHVVSAAGGAYGFKGDSAFKLPASAKRATASRKALAGEESAAKLPSIDPAPWFKSLKAEPERLAGVETTHISGALDSKHMARDVRGLLHSSGKAGDDTVKLPTDFANLLAKTFRGARLDANVGTTDKVVRRLRVTKTGAFPAGVLDKGGSARWRVALALDLTGVNKPQKIAAPEKTDAKTVSRRSLRTADGAFIASAVALDPPAGLVQMGVNYLRIGARARTGRVARRVEAAVRAHKRVVLFFYQRSSVGDRPTARSVASLHKRTKAVVFADNVDNLAAYGEAVQKVGVTRAPSVVIIGKSGRARVIEGYIDPQALAQEVADTR